MTSRDSKTILILTSASHFVVHCSMVLLPSLFVILKGEFQISIATLGWIYSLSNFGFGLGAIPAGIAEGKVGARTLLIIFLLGVIGSTVAIMFTHSAIGLIISLFALGLFSSIYHPAGLTLISRRDKYLSSAMGIHGIAGTVGLAAGPFIASGMAVIYSWRLAYGLIAIVSTILLLMILILIPSKGNHLNSIPSKNSSLATQKRPLYIYFILSFLVGFTFYGFKTYMPLHFSQSTTTLFKDMNVVFKGGLLTSISLLVGIFGQLIGGWLGDRFNRTSILPLVFIFQVPVLMAFGLNSGVLLLVSGILIGIIHFIFQPIGNVLVADYTTSLSRGVGYGISFFLSFGIGSIASGIGGVISDRYGVSYVFYLLSGCMVLSFALAMCLKKFTSKVLYST